MRALLQDPQLLFLDEPLNHLDPESKRLVMRALRGFLSLPGRALVWISHSGSLEAEMSEFKTTGIALGGEKGARG